MYMCEVKAMCVQFAFPDEVWAGELSALTRDTAPASCAQKEATI